MRSKLLTLLTVIGALTVLVLAGNTVALATTGKAILAGKINTSTKMTSIARTTPGTGLQVKTKSSANSPFAVNGKGKVTNLNADRLDGLDSSVLGTRAYVFTGAQFAATSDLTYTLPLPSGSYQVNYTVFLNGAGAGGVECFVKQTGSPDLHTAYSSLVHSASPDAWSPSLTGTGLVTKSATSTITVSCDSEGANFSPAGSAYPVRIVAVPTRVISTQNIPVG